ncbi:response regulator [Verrucomicrobiota bacterium]
MADTQKKLLIADDEADVHEFLHAVLERDGLVFIDAADGEEAVNKALAESPDLVILDVQMPKKDGFRVFAELQANEATKSIPVVMLTAVSARTGVKVDGKDMGSFLGKEPAAYVDKPIDPDKISEVVESLL